MTIMRYPDIAVQSSGTNATNFVAPRVTFTPYNWVAPTPTLESTKLTQGGSGDSVCLYLPNGFSEKYSANWQETEIVASAIGTAMSKDKSLADNVAGAFSGMNKSNLATDAMAAATKMGQASAGGIVNSVLYTNGVTPFPGQFNMFNKGMPIDMDFTFDMVPRTKTEGNSIVKICSHFKDKILAEYKAGSGVSQYMLTFPDIWRISFTGINGVGYAGGTEKNVYPDMALTSCNVSYGGGAQSALTFHDGNPVVITLALSFKAIKPSYKMGGS